MNMSDRCRELLMQSFNGTHTPAVMLENGKPAIQYDTIELSQVGSRLRISFFFSGEEVGWIDGPLPHFGGGDTATIRDVYGRIPVEVEGSAAGEWPRQTEPEQPEQPTANRARRIRI